MESEPDDFHATIRTAFLALAAEHPERYLVLPARGAIAELALAIEQRVHTLLAAPGNRTERSSTPRGAGSA